MAAITVDDNDVMMIQPFHVDNLDESLSTRS